MDHRISLPVSEKEAARQFLFDLRERLLLELPSPSAMRKAIAEMVEKAKGNNNKYLHEPEYAFLNGYAVPAIFAQMQTVKDITEEEARGALLSEWYRGMPQYHRNSPRRLWSHPFGKSRQEPKKIMQRWRGEERDSQGRARKPLHQACPDLALGDPFPHKVIFEVKYFSKGDSVAAETQLVNGIYEAFYYLAMPSIPAGKRHPAWRYDFGCFLAFDASVDGSLLEAWTSIRQETRNEFWEGGNLFVMIIRTPEAAA